MTYWWLGVALISIGLIYLATRNLFSYQLMFYWIVLPGIIVLPSNVGVVMAIGTLALALGLLAGNRIFKFDPKKELAKLRKSPMTSTFGSVPVGLYAVGFLIALTIAIGILYYGSVGIALLSEQVGVARMLLKSVAGAWIVMRFIRVVLPVLVFICYAHWYKRMTLSRYVRLAALICVTALMLAATGFKGDVLIFLAIPGIFLVSFIHPKISLRFILVFGLGAVVAAFVVAGATIRSANLRDIYDFLWHRLAYQNFDGLTYIVQYYVPVNGFQGGRTYWTDLMSLLYKLHLTHTPAMNLAARVSREMVGAHNYIGTQAAVYLEGETYANFGMTGVVTGGFVVGVLMQALYVFTVRLRKDAVVLPFLVMLQVGIMLSLGGDFLPMVIDYLMTISLSFMLLLATYVFASIPFREVKFRLPTWTGTLLRAGTQP